MEIQLWRELLDPYQLAVDELTVKFHHIIEAVSYTHLDVYKRQQYARAFFKHALERV